MVLLSLAGCSNGDAYEQFQLESAAGLLCVSVPGSFIDPFYTAKEPGPVRELYLIVPDDKGGEVRFRVSNGSGKRVENYYAHLREAIGKVEPGSGLVHLDDVELDSRTFHYSRDDGVLIVCHNDGQVNGACSMEYVSRQGLHVRTFIPEEDVQKFGKHFEATESALEQILCKPPR